MKCATVWWKNPHVYIPTVRTEARDDDISIEYTDTEVFAGHPSPTHANIKSVENN